MNKFYVEPTYKRPFDVNIIITLYTSNSFYKDVSYTCTAL